MEGNSKSKEKYRLSKAIHVHVNTFRNFNYSRILYFEITKTACMPKI